MGQTKKSAEFLLQELEALKALQRYVSKMKVREYFDFTGSVTADPLVLPAGWKPIRVWVNGSTDPIFVKGTDWTESVDMNVYSVVPVSAIGVNAVLVLAERV